MTQLTSSVTPAQQQSMLGMAQLGTKQENDARQAGLAAKQLELERDKLRVSEEQSGLDRRLSRESQALGAIEGERSREFQDGLVTRQIEGNKAQSILDSELREGVTKRMQERQVKVDQIRRRAELDAMDVDTTDLRDRLNDERNAISDMQMRQMEAEARRQGKLEEFMKAKAKLAQHYEEQGNTFASFEETFGEAFDSESLEGIALLKKFGIDAGVEGYSFNNEPESFLGSLANIGSRITGAVTSAHEDFFLYVANQFRDEDSQMLTGDRRLLKEGIDRLFGGEFSTDGILSDDPTSSLHRNSKGGQLADRMISEHIGESMAIALGKSELADEIVSSVDLAIKAGRGTGVSEEDYRKQVTENLPEGVDPKAFFRGLEMANREFGQFVRKYKRSQTDGLQPEEVMSYALSRAFRTTNLGEAVAKGPDIPDSQWHLARGNTLRATQGRTGLESIEDPDNELGSLMSILDVIDTEDQGITDRGKSILLRERGLGDLSRDNQTEIDRRQIAAALRAIDGEDYSGVFKP